MQVLIEDGRVSYRARTWAEVAALGYASNGRAVARECIDTATASAAAVLRSARRAYDALPARDRPRSVHDAAGWHRVAMIALTDYAPRPGLCDLCGAEVRFAGDDLCGPCIDYEMVGAE